MELDILEGAGRWPEVALGAAIAGFADSLGRSAGGEGTRRAAASLEELKHALSVAAGSLDEFRFHAFEAESADAITLTAEHYDRKLTEAGWDSTLRMQKDEGLVRLYLLRDEGAIRGAFVVAGDRKGVALVNAVGDVSPENVKRLSASLGRSGKELGAHRLIDRVSQKIAEEIGREFGSGATPPSAPAPPEAPRFKPPVIDEAE